MVEPAALERVLEAKSLPTAMADALVAQAIRNGGKDNVTVLLVHVSAAKHMLQEVGLKYAVPGLLLLTALALGVLTGLRWRKTPTPPLKPPVVQSQERQNAPTSRPSSTPNAIQVRHLPF